jgi:hypothetical protein
MPTRDAPHGTATRGSVRLQVSSIAGLKAAGEAKKLLQHLLRNKLVQHDRKKCAPKHR